MLYFVAGAVGSLAKDIIQDNQLRLPYVKDGYVVLGFLGGMFVGAFVGWCVDGSFLTAALGGYVGTSAISNLLPPVKKP